MKTPAHREEMSARKLRREERDPTRVLEIGGTPRIHAVHAVDEFTAENKQKAEEKRLRRQSMRLERSK